MQTHELKTLPEPFEAIWDGRKRYEVRVDDRGFQVGDRLRLREYHPAKGYSGRVVEVDVTYMTPGGDFGLPRHMCVLGLAAWLRSADQVKHCNICGGEVDLTNATKPTITPGAGGRR